MPGMAGVLLVVAMTLVMMDLSIMLSVRVGMRTVVMMTLMKPGVPLDLLKLGMQHHGHLQRLPVSHFQMGHFHMGHLQVNPG